MANEKVIILEEGNFNETIKEGVTLVDFWAEWCGPCKMQGPIIDEVAKKSPEGIKVAKLNIDDSRSIAAQYNIMSIPTILIFKDGKVLNQMVGLQKEPELLNALDKA